MIRTTSRPTKGGWKTQCEIGHGTNPATIPGAANRNKIEPAMAASRRLFCWSVMESSRRAGRLTPPALLRAARAECERGNAQIDGLWEKPDEVGDRAWLLRASGGSAWDLELDSKVPVSGDPAGHELDHCDLEEGAGGGGGAFEVASEAPVDEAQAKVRSTTQRLGWTTKPASVRLMISTGRGAAAATRGPW